MPADHVRLHDPMLVAKYVAQKNLIKEGGWEWVTSFLETNPVRRAFATVLKMNNESSQTFKFGVEVPRSVKHALELDKQNNNTGWADAIRKELKQLSDCQTFKVVPQGSLVPSGYKRIPLPHCV